MKDNQYKTEAELHGMSEFLQPDVDKIEHIKWLIGVLNNPRAPKRVIRPKAPAQKGSKTKHNKDNIVLWSDDELQEGMHHFIVDDDPYKEAQHRTQPPGLQEDDSEHSVRSVSLDPTQSFVSGTSDDIEMHDLTRVDDSPFRSQDTTLINLVTPTKQKRGSATPRGSAKRTAQSASPAVGKFPLSDPQAIANKGSFYWEERGDFERAIVSILHGKHKARLDDVFHSVLYLQVDGNSESFREEYIDVICCSENSRDSRKTTKERKQYGTPRLLTRLFAIYLKKHSKSTPSKFQGIDSDLIEHVQGDMRHRAEFLALLTTIAPYFSYTEVKGEHLSPDEDSPGSSGARPTA